jgi:hypothetical protein
MLDAASEISASIGRLDQMLGRLAEIEWQLTRYLMS